MKVTDQGQGTNNLLPCLPVSETERLVVTASASPLFSVWIEPTETANANSIKLTLRINTSSNRFLNFAIITE